MSRRVVIAAGLVMLAICGCATSRKLTSRSELTNLAADRPITVYAQDARVYRLRQHTLADSAIHGSGALSRRGETKRFQGAIPFAEIRAVEANSRSVMKTLAMAGIAALFVAYATQGTGSSGRLTATEDVSYVAPPPPPSCCGGGSCPYLYAWDGARYELQAEPFGIAWGKALELTTLHLLPAVRAENGVVRLRLTNEREETHYVNSIQLRAIHLGTAAGTVLDGEGRAWPLSHPVAPSTGRDESGRDILGQIASADGRMWECDASSLTAGSGYENVLDVTFARPRHASTGTLILTATNSALWTAVYSHLCQAVGGQTGLLAHAIETDPELIAQMRDYLRDASLEALVWNGSDWETAGMIAPEASAVTFTRALRVRIPDRAGDRVRVRLRSMADVWKVDAIAAEWGDARPLAMSPLDMLSAVGPSGEDLGDRIGADDGQYAILLPPDRVELTFAAARPATGGKVVYAVAGRGYLHEWEPRTAGAGLTLLASHAPEEGRIEFLKELLKHRDLALAPVYEAWRKVRGR
ncbi:MAG: hypothetical protein ACRENJ_08680 [Candidatus Eiseniibacteriota bacterium]